MRAQRETEAQARARAALEKHEAKAAAFVGDCADKASRDVLRFEGFFHEATTMETCRACGVEQGYGYMKYCKSALRRASRFAPSDSTNGGGGGRRALAPGLRVTLEGSLEHHAALHGETLVLGAQNADGTWRATCAAVPGHEFTLNAANCVPAPEAGPSGEAPDWDALLRPLKDRYATLVSLLGEGTAVEASYLSGLDASGCAAGATALCETCHRCLVSKDPSKRVPPHALVNGTWQGAVPPELRFESVEYPDGLNLVEMSMIAIYNPILTVTILTGGA
jgi:hypothetical protein